MRRLFLIVSLAALAALAGCINYSEDLKLNPDGSGTVAMRFALNRAFMDQMGQMAAGSGDSASDPVARMRSSFDRGRIEKQLDAAGAGVKLLDYEEAVSDSEYAWNMTFSFAHYGDLERMNTLFNLDEDAGDEAAPAAGGDDDAQAATGGEESPSPELTYEKQADGTWLFRRSLEDAGADEGMGDDVGAAGEDSEAWSEDEEDGEEGVSGSDSPLEESAGDTAAADSGSVEDMQDLDTAMEDAMQQMASMWKDAGATFTVHFPGTIVESNATRTEGNTAVWSFTLRDMAPGASMKAMTARVRP